MPNGNHGGRTRGTNSWHAVNLALESVSLIKLFKELSRWCMSLNKLKRIDANRPVYRDNPSVRHAPPGCGTEAPDDGEGVSKGIRLHSIRRMFVGNVQVGVIQAVRFPRLPVAFF